MKKIMIIIAAVLSISTVSFCKSKPGSMGFLFAEKYRHPVVMAVYPGGPAYAARLQEGDILLEINGKSLDGFDMTKPEALKGNEGEHVKLKVFRDFEVFTVDMDRMEISEASLQEFYSSKTASFIGEKIYFDASYEDVWKGVLQLTTKYMAEIEMKDIDGGVIQSKTFYQTMQYNGKILTYKREPYENEIFSDMRKYISNIATLNNRKFVGMKVPWNALKVNLSFIISRESDGKTSLIINPVYEAANRIDGWVRIDSNGGLEYSSYLFMLKFLYDKPLPEKKPEPQIVNSPAGSSCFSLCEAETDENFKLCMEKCKSL